MSSGEIRIGDVGTVFEITLMEDSDAVDVSSATLKQIIFEDPGGATHTKSAGFTTTGVDGKIRYVTIAGDLNRTGKWKLQAYVETPAGKWHSDISTFRVYPNL